MKNASNARRLSDVLLACMRLKVLGWNTDLRESALGEDTGGEKSATGLTKPIKVGRETCIKRQVFPHAPSPTMTSLRRISAILLGGQSTRQQGSLGPDLLSRCLKVQSDLSR